MKKIIFFIFAITCFLSFKTGVFAADEACEGDQNYMNQCAEDRSKKAGAELQKYQEALQKGLSGQNEKIQASQKDWQNYAQKYCELYASDFEGGSGWPYLYFSCVERMTRQRILDLKNLLMRYEIAIPK